MNGHEFGALSWWRPVTPSALHRWEGDAVKEADDNPDEQEPRNPGFGAQGSQERQDRGHQHSKTEDLEKTQID